MSLNPPVPPRPADPPHSPSSPGPDESQEWQESAASDGVCAFASLEDGCRLAGRPAVVCQQHKTLDHSPFHPYPVPGLADTFGVVLLVSRVGRSEIFQAESLPGPAGNSCCCRARPRPGPCPAGSQTAGSREGPERVVRTGVAIVNPGGQRARVDLKVIDADGRVAGSAALRLAAGAQVDPFVDELFPVVPADFRGVLELSTTTEGVVSTGLLQTGRVTTSLPVHPCRPWTQSQ